MKRLAKISLYLCLCIGLFFAPIGQHSANAEAFIHHGVIREVRKLEVNEMGLTHPIGLAYLPVSNHLLVSESMAENKIKLSEITLFDHLIYVTSLDGSITGASSIIFDSHFNRLLLIDSATSEIIAINSSAKEKISLQTNSVKHFNTKEFNLRNLQGLTIDPVSGELFILDNTGLQILVLKPDQDGNLDSSSVVIDKRALKFNLRDMDLNKPQTLAYNSENNHLYLLFSKEQSILEMTTQGEVISMLDISPFGLTSPESMLFAPSADPTDPTSITHLYIADTGGSPSSGVPTNGQIVEFALTAAPQALNTVPTDMATLIKTTLTSAYSPPSPDPDGLAYLPDRNSLLISDSEVNEIPNLFTGKNLFEVSLSGQVLNTYTTLTTPSDFSDEPTGVAYNPQNRHLYFSDDNSFRVWELNPAGDGLYNTSDDVITYFRTNSFSSNDPEGITYDTSRGHLLLIDGTGAEVYDIDPGSDGIFTGVDNNVSHFDTEALGIIDPEGIEFNPYNGHLYLLASHDRLIAETLTDGTLIRYISVSSANPRMLGDLAYAPASSGSGSNNLYLVSRGIDNNEDPNENDGVLYEMTFPQSETNQSPIVHAGFDQAITLPASASLAGTVSDDGLPNPPGAVTLTWSEASGPGTVTFVNPNTASTSASFSAAGTYVLRLTASDSTLSSYDDVTITVNPAPPVNQPPMVKAGIDQAITLPASASLIGSVSDDGLPIPPGTTSVTWSKVSGVGTVIFSNPNAVNTTATFSAAGSYTLQLTAYDGALSAYDEVSITINPTPPVNQAPVVDAGPDQTITLPASATLVGTVSDDGLPNPPGTTSVNWSKTSGPGTVTFADASLVSTTASFSIQGTYILRLTANDSALSSYDEITITVNPAAPVNQAPIVNAGPDQTIALSASANLSGTVTDDGLPAPSNLSYTWSRVSGGGRVTFSDANSLQTSVKFSKLGTFVIRLTTSDGALSSFDDLTVIVVQSLPNNQPPNVDAGSDQTITLPADAVLSANVNDDGLPNPPGALAINWDKISGPGNVTFANRTSVNTTASFSESGTYTLHLTANDGAQTRSDEVQITVLPVGTQALEIRIINGNDDAEESGSGRITLNSRSLELVYYKDNQTVGLRFKNLNIPQGAVIQNAYIQFKADKASSGTTSLVVQGQAADSSGEFIATNFDISSRPRTSSATAWSPSAWTAGAADVEQRTPNLATVIQEIIDRSGWALGNSVVIIITGTGIRVAEAFEGDSTGAALLHIEYSIAN